MGHVALKNEDYHYYNQPEFVAILRSEFAKEQRDTGAKLQAALALSDFKTAYLLVHTLKGNSGLINEPELEKLAAKVSIILKAGQMPGKYTLELLQTSLDMVLNSIEIPKRPPITSWEDVDKESARTLLNKIKRSLESSTPECFDLLGGLIRLPKTNELIDLIEKCEFDDALVALNKLSAELEGICHEN